MGAKKRLPKGGGAQWAHWAEGGKCWRIDAVAGGVTGSHPSVSFADTSPYRGGFWDAKLSITNYKLQITNYGREKGSLVVAGASTRPTGGERAAEGGSVGGWLGELTNANKRATMVNVNHRQRKEVTYGKNRVSGKEVEVWENPG